MDFTHLDFALILVVLTAVAGLIWIFDLLFLKRSRIAAIARGESGREPLAVEYAKSFFPILLLVLVIRSFLFEPFRIPSGSMMPTLLTGDFIFVNKFAYGLRLPVLNTKIVEIGEPQHGDVVVFRLPSNPSINYIKRVVGLPGDVVEYDDANKRLTIDGKPIAMELVGPWEGDSSAQLGREQLGEHDHRLLVRRGAHSFGGRFVVPPGHYFMMGDNRDNSSDSRDPNSGVAYVPEGNLVGRATRVWMNMPTWKFWLRPGDGGPQWSRIGKGVE